MHSSRQIKMLILPELMLVMHIYEMWALVSQRVYIGFSPHYKGGNGENGETKYFVGERNGKECPPLTRKRVIQVLLQPG